jgi:hypothetical protein
VPGRATCVCVHTGAGETTRSTDRSRVSDLLGNIFGAEPRPRLLRKYVEVR